MAIRSRYPYTRWWSWFMSVAHDLTLLIHVIQIMIAYCWLRQLWFSFKEILDGLKELTHEDLKVRDIIGEVSAIHNTCPQCGDGCDRSTCIHAASDGRIKGPADGFWWTLTQIAPAAWYFVQFVCVCVCVWIGSFVINSVGTMSEWVSEWWFNIVSATKAMACNYMDVKSCILI